MAIGRVGLNRRVGLGRRGSETTYKRSTERFERFIRRAVPMTTNIDNHKYFLCIVVLGALLCPAALVGSVCLGFANEFDLIRSERSISPFTKIIQCLLILGLSIVSSGLAWFLARQITIKRSFADMIHAVLSVILYFCVVSAWTIALWPWLADGKGTNVDTIAKIAIVSSALPTVLFVIWRERVASDTSLDQRFQNAITALGNQTESVRIAAIHSLMPFRPHTDYRNAALAALRSHAATGPFLSVREIATINQAIQHLQNV